MVVIVLMCLLFLVGSAFLLVAILRKKFTTDFKNRHDRLFHRIRDLEDEILGERQATNDLRIRLEETRNLMAMYERETYERAVSTRSIENQMLAYQNALLANPRPIILDASPAMSSGQLANIIETIPKKGDTSDIEENDEKSDNPTSDVRKLYFKKRGG